MGGGASGRILRAIARVALIVTIIACSGGVVVAGSVAALSAVAIAATAGGRLGGRLAVARYSAVSCRGGSRGSSGFPGWVGLTGSSVATTLGGGGGGKEWGEGRNQAWYVTRSFSAPLLKDTPEMRAPLY